MKTYTETIKARMIRKMMRPNGVSATALAADTGISQATLSRWRNRAGAGTVTAVQAKKRQQITRTGKRAQDWTPQERLQVVSEAVTVGEDELGAFLRRKGLHRQQLERWRESATAALEDTSVRSRRRRSGPTPEQKRIRDLERQLRRKEKALAEAAALLILKKKYETLFEDVEDDTDPRSAE